MSSTVLPATESFLSWGSSFVSMKQTGSARVLNSGQLRRGKVLEKRREEEEVLFPSGERSNHCRAFLPARLRFLSPRRGGRLPRPGRACTGRHARTDRKLGIINHGRFNGRKTGKPPKLFVPLSSSVPLLMAYFCTFPYKETL